MRASLFIKKAPFMTLPTLTHHKKLPLLYDFPEYIRDPLAFWLNAARTAPLLKVRLTSLREFLVATDPDFIQYMMQTKPKVYVREQLTMDIHRAGRDTYSFNTKDWEEWLWRRRLMQPAFHKQQLAQFGAIMVEEAERIAKEWKDNIDLETAMKTLTMRIIGRTMFSFEFGEEMQALQEAYNVWGKYIFIRASVGINLPIWLPLPLNVQTRRAIDKRLAILKSIVMKRFESQQPKPDLLDMLLNAKLDEGQTFNREQLIHELDGIVFAGHDTTAITLTWIFYHLAQNPEVETKLLAEIEQVLGKRIPTLEDIEHMPYTQMVIQEALRLYPPVYVTVRENMEEDTWQEHTLPAHTSILVNIYGLQRSPEHWVYPDEFNPENFSPEHSQNRHKYAFMPFIMGPRKCMGDSFAMMEMQLLIPTILQHVRLRYSGDHPVKPKPEFVMHPAEAIPMKVERV
jgi:cytochrome P450